MYDNYYRSSIKTIFTTISVVLWFSSTGSLKCDEKSIGKMCYRPARTPQDIFSTRTDDATYRLLDDYIRNNAKLTCRASRWRAPCVQAPRCSCTWGRTWRPVSTAARWRSGPRAWGPAPGSASRWDRVCSPGRWTALAAAESPAGWPSTPWGGGSWNMPARPARTTIWQSSVITHQRKRVSESASPAMVVTAMLYTSSL